MVTDFFPCVFSNHFIVYMLRLCLWPTDLSSIWGGRCRSRLIFCICMLHFSSTICWRVSFLPWIAFSHLLKINWPYSWGPISKLSLLFHRSTMSIYFYPSLILGINNLYLLSLFSLLVWLEVLLTLLVFLKNEL